MFTLLDAERRGRGFLYQVTPAAMDAGGLEMDVLDDPNGHALLAAARAASCLGLRARVRVRRPDSPSAIWRLLLPGARHFADVVESDGIAASAGRVVGADGGGRFFPVPDGRSDWGRPLSVSLVRVRPDNGSSRAFSRAESREIDRIAIQEYGVPGICLMENAAMGVMAVALDMIGAGGGEVLVVAGGGNNGGDGLAMARGFCELGIGVEVALFKPPRMLEGDALANFELLSKTPVAVREIGSHPEFLESLVKGRVLVVDALLGTGFDSSAGGGLTPGYLEAVRILNASGVPVLSVDIPSGLDADSGVPGGDAVRAERTCTLAVVKRGLRVAAAREFVGELYLADIGMAVPHF